MLAFCIFLGDYLSNPTKVGNLGNIAGSYTWKEQYFGPAYRESCVIGIVALSLSTVMALCKFLFHLPSCELTHF